MVGARNRAGKRQEKKLCHPKGRQRCRDFSTIRVITERKVKGEEEKRGPAHTGGVQLGPLRGKREIPNGKGVTNKQNTRKSRERLAGSPRMGTSRLREERSAHRWCQMGPLQEVRKGSSTGLGVTGLFSNGCSPP